MSASSRLRFRFWMIPPAAVLVIACAVAAGLWRDDVEADRRLDRVEASARAFTKGQVLITTAFMSDADHICGTFATWGGPDGRDAGAFDESAGGVRIDVESDGFQPTDVGCVARVHDLSGVLAHRDAARRHG
jgi:hypothetical protein